MAVLERLKQLRGALARLGELRRVLRAGNGRLAVSTNAADDKLENGKLWREALLDLGVFDPPPYPFDDRRFSLQVAERRIRTRVERAGAFVIKCHAGVITATA